ncbi:hybrid sensor histidine kinase/response regulator [Mangrovitalea sediminis]|uniref:hybrid sensor histidine kinase/response regulator n=1 Tax=Mangrovitalea sediminis TaxID=1982043 RepID=UPI000BE56198|nr:ATP-binding protein [Mangrovitalea sediminis]
MKIDVAKRLSFKLARNTVLLALTLGILLNFVQVTFDYFNAQRAMDQEIRALLDISHSPASQIAYNIDTRLAQELLTGLLQHPAIVQAKIVDPDGRVLAKRERPVSESPYRWLSDLLFGAKRQYTEQLRVPQLSDIDLGHLDLVVDTYYYGTAFLQRAASTIISGFARSLILAVILLFLYYVMLTKPLLAVIEALSQVDTDTREKIRLPIPLGHREDEIGLLVSITNEHLDKIDENLQKLREAEGRLKGYSEELEQIVEARTREISDKNEALQRSNRAQIQAKEDAMRRARARANFLASMSHEIRTPLNGLLGMVSLALDEELSPAQRNRLQIALSAGHSLQSLLNDILDISKVEAGKLSLEHIPFSLRELAEENAALLSQQAARKQVAMVVDVAPDLPDTYLGDPTRIRQIIANLLGNAIKFTDKGSVTLRVEAASQGVMLRISDTGIGISELSLERIFSPFSQAHSDTTRRFGGTGLGLALCRQLVDRMRGSINVESQENVGTSFIVTLPLEIAEDASAGADPRFLKGYRVLLNVSEEYLHRPALVAQLEYWGAEVSIRPSLEPEILKQDNPDILLIRSATLRSQRSSLPAEDQAKILVLDEPENRLTDADTTIRVQLPLCRAQFRHAVRAVLGMAEEVLPGRSDQSNMEDISLQGVRVLLVEDNRVNQIVASGMLRKLGCAVTLAENGERALTTLEKQSFDMVLMDCQMPVMDGFEATRHIRQNGRWKDLPVIAVTANVMQGDREDCLRAGMNDYVTKPYNMDALRVAISKWLTDRASHRLERDA